MSKSRIAMHKRNLMLCGCYLDRLVPQLVQPMPWESLEALLLADLRKKSR